MVMLLDYQQNGFYFGTERFKNKKVEIPEKENSIPHILEIQKAMVSHRIKLRAALARSRIRDCAISVEALLPKEEQDKLQYAAQQPVYARVNTWKASYSDILETLTSEGFLMEDSLPSPEDDETGADGRADEWVKTIFSVTKHHNIVASFFRNITTLCCAKSRRCESSRVTSPLGMGLSARVEFHYERCLRKHKMQIKTLSETS